MFMVDEETAAAVQRAYAERGEQAAVVELRRRFRITDNAEAVRCVRVIVGWKAKE